MKVGDPALDALLDPGSARPPEHVRDGEAVHLRGERAEAVAVGGGLAGERQGQERAAVEAGIEGQHRGPPGGAARDLDRVLDRLGAAGEERRLGRAGNRDDLAQLARQRHVRLVGRHHETGVLELLHLRARAVQHARRRVTRVQAADAAAEVEELVAVDVDEQRPFSALEEDPVPRLRDARRDPAPALLEQRPAPWSRQRGLDRDRAHAQYHPTGLSLRLTCTCLSSR